MRSAPTNTMLAAFVLAAAVACEEMPEVATGVSVHESYFAAAERHEAEKDRFKRCNAYPDLPGYNWSPSLMRAICGDYAAPVESPAQIQSMVVDKDWTALHDLYSGRLKRHHTGADPERVLYRLFMPVQWSSQKDLDASSEKWLEAAPDSPFAKVLRAKVLIAMAWAERGEGLARDIPEERMREVRQLAERAESLAESGLETEPRLMPAYEALIEATSLSGGARTTDVLQRAIQASPETYYIRRAALNYLQPKWGGRREAMDQVVDDAQKLVSENARMPLLRAWRKSFDAGSYISREQFGPALDGYRAALAFGPEFGTLREAVWVASRAGQHAESAMLAGQLIRLNGKMVDALSSRGLAFERMEEWQRALQDHSAAAERDPFNPDHLARIAAIHHRRQNFARAEEFYLKTLELDSDHTEALRGACRMWVHLTLEPRKAEPYAQQLVRLIPEDPDAWLLLANVQHSLKRPEVHATARRFLELAPVDDPEFAGPIRNIERFLGER